MAERLCAHEPCHCEPEPGSEFCSAACARETRRAAPGEVASDCPCGHPECRPEHVSEHQPPPHAQP
jgi:hypothetical protein